MMTMGSTISLAGKPSRKAMRITPSRPSRRAKGSKKPVHQLRMLSPPTCTLAHSQISRPAGAATAAARPSTKRVRSSTERTTTCPTRGLRKGGSSRVKEEGTPFSTVADRSREAQKVSRMPSRITPVSSRAASRPPASPPAVPAKNMERIAISVGNGPPEKGQIHSRQRVKVSASPSHRHPWSMARHRARRSSRPSAAPARASYFPGKWAST